MCLTWSGAAGSTEQTRQLRGLFKRAVTKQVISNMEQNQVDWKSSLVRKASQFSRDELRCMRVRKYLAVLPSYDPVKTGFFDLLKTRKLGRFNSYRSIAYDLLGDISNFDQLADVRRAKQAL